jgi:hypothetical protein
MKHRTDTKINSYTAAAIGSLCSVSNDASDAHNLRSSRRVRYAGNSGCWQGKVAGMPPVSPFRRQPSGMSILKKRKIFSKTIKNLLKNRPIREQLLHIGLIRY